MALVTSLENAAEDVAASEETEALLDASSLDWLDTTELLTDDAAKDVLDGADELSDSCEEIVASLDAAGALLIGTTCTDEDCPSCELALLTNEDVLPGSLLWLLLEEIATGSDDAGCEEGSASDDVLATVEDSDDVLESVAPPDVELPLLELLPEPPPQAVSASPTTTPPTQRQNICVRNICHSQLFLCDFSACILTRHWLSVSARIRNGVTKQRKTREQAHTNNAGELSGAITKQQRPVLPGRCK